MRKRSGREPLRRMKGKQERKGRKDGGTKLTTKTAFGKGSKYIITSIFKKISAEKFL